MNEPVWNGYPSLFQASDASASLYRQRFLWAQRLQLGSLALASLAGVAALALRSSASRWVYTTVAVLMFGGLVLNWISRGMGLEKLWFDCRAVAESVKTATWRFMMGAPPFSLSPADEAKFVDELRTIRRARPEAAKCLAGQLNEGIPVITSPMSEARALHLEERMAFYVEERIADQHSWYTKRANWHAKSATRWFYAVVVLQVLAVVAAIVIAVTGSMSVDVIAVITTLAAAVIAWDTRRRNTELSHAYALAAQEIGSLQALANGLDGPAECAEFVDQVEETISREHTLWCARRDVDLS